MRFSVFSSMLGVPARCLIVGILAVTAGCADEPSTRTISATLQPGQLFEYSAVSGDEDGATLVVQARHAAVSEIRRSAQTNWAAVYVYRPEDQYSGTDAAT